LCEHNFGGLLGVPFGLGLETVSLVSETVPLTSVTVPLTSVTVPLTSVTDPLTSVTDPLTSVTGHTVRTTHIDKVSHMGGDATELV